MFKNLKLYKIFFIQSCKSFILKSLFTVLLYNFIIFYNKPIILLDFITLNNNLVICIIMLIS